MSVKTPQHVRESQLNDLPGKRFVRWVDGEYRNAKSKAMMVCDSGHEWVSSTHRLLNQRCGCPVCAGNVAATKCEIERRLRSAKCADFIRWSDVYKNRSSLAVMRCHRGHEWSTKVSNLLRGHSCPRCAHDNMRSDSHSLEKRLNDIEGMRFVKWSDGRYVNLHSKALMRCYKNHTWSASARNLIDKKSGCPMCSSTSLRPSGESEALLNALQGMMFVRWGGVYKNANSKAVMRCELGHEWAARLNNLLNSGNGCPHCAQYGFNLEAPATLYTLRSECGQHVKVGVTGHLEQRLAQLKRATPFEFSTVALVHGAGHEIRDLEKMFHANFESSGFTGFDGATEWLKFDPNIPALMKILGA